MAVWRSVRESLAFLSRRHRLVLLLIVCVQVCLAFLDLAAVVLIGVVVAVATNSIAESSAVSASMLQKVGLDGDLSLSQVAALAALAGALLITKSVLSFLVMRRSFRFLANRQAEISAHLADELLMRPLLEVQRHTSQDISYALTAGTSAIALGVLGQGIVIVSEVGLLVVLGFGLILLDPIVTLFTIVFFAVVGLAMHRVIARTGARLGASSSRLSIGSIEAVQDLVHSYRELYVSGRRQTFLAEFADLRWKYARNQGDLQSIGQVSKYVFEVALVVGGALLVATQAMTRDLAAGLTAIVIFLAAASRIMPALLRLQSAALGIRIQSGVAESTFAIARLVSSKDMKDATDIPSILATPGGAPSTLAERFDGAVVCDRVTFAYPGAALAAVSEVSLVLPPQSSLAIVGESGAGKSTLADLILGIISPTAGSVTVSGLPPATAIDRWSGAVAYVPQDASMINGDVRRNVALGIPAQQIDDDAVWHALELVRMADYLREQRDGLKTRVGEGGLRLSGGQRQRLGIARALYSQPQLIVLDEATSALDAETELAVSQSLRILRGSVTLVVIAHRLATIRDLDLVAALSAGRLVGLGAFADIRRDVESINRHARIQGL